MDGAVFKSTHLFTLEEVPGTAKLENNAHAKGIKIDDSALFSPAGAKMGYSELDGVIKPGFKYAGYLTFTVRIVAPGF